MSLKAKLTTHALRFLQQPVMEMHTEHAQYNKLDITRWREVKCNVVWFYKDIEWNRDRDRNYVEIRTTGLFSLRTYLLHALSFYQTNAIVYPCFKTVNSPSHHGRL